MPRGAGAARSHHLTPEQVAPFFWLTALIHLAAVVSRFGDVAVLLPQGIAAAIFLAQIPLLFVEGYFEGRLDYGDSVVDLPGWMRIKSKPVKLSFTFAFVYLAIVLLQTWDVSIGPIDPSPPDEWPLQQRAMWFGMMTLGMFFPNYLAAAGLLIPALRTVTAPFRRMPAMISLPILTVIGGGLGYALLGLLMSETIGSGFDSFYAVLEERPALAIGLTLAMVWIPIMFELIREGSSDD